MKKIRILSIVAVLCLLSTACGKDGVSYNRFTMRDVDFTDNGSKVTLHYNSSLAKLIYQDGDAIKVNNTDFTLQNQGSYWQAVAASSVDAVNGKFYMAYADNGSISSFNSGAGTYYFDISSQVNTTGTNGVILGGTTTDSNITLAPACAIIRLNTNDPYDHVKVGFEANKVPKTGTLTVGNKSASIAPASYLDPVSDLGGGSFGGQFLYMERCNDGWYVGVPVPNDGVTTKIYFEWETSSHVVTRYSTSGPVSLAKGHIYSVGTTRLSPFSDYGYTNSAFNVSASHQVVFSAGNLQFQRYREGGLTWKYKWRFAPNQYDRIGDNNQNVPNNTWLDLMGWATSGYNNGQAAYQPNSKSTTASDYYASAIEGTQSDWGVKNSASPGIYYGSELVQDIPWRTLTAAEWTYLINNRSGKAGLATIAGSYNGLVLLPDDAPGGGAWTCPASCSWTPGYGSGYNTNTFTAAQWSAMEYSGAIFLPAGGHRNGDDPEGDNTYGYYWSTTNGNATKGRALGMAASGYSVTMKDKFYGVSVRLVADIEDKK